MQAQATLLSLLLFSLTHAFDPITDQMEFEVPPICRPQLQTANCWYYRPNYVYNHLLSRCIFSGWSSCNSKLNSFRTREECDRVCIGDRRPSADPFHQRNRYHHQRPRQPSYFDEFLPRNNYWPP